MRDAMDQLRQSQFENKKRAQQVYQEMKGREPELWKAFGFAHEGDYLMFNDLTDLINSDL